MMESLCGTRLRLVRLVLIISMTSYMAVHVSGDCVSMDICQGIVGYNLTIFPNTVAHESYDQAVQTYNQFLPLINSNCSNTLHKFLCYTLFTVCTPLDTAIPVCRSVCEAALTNDCLETSRALGIELFTCEGLPETGLCISDNGTSDTDNSDIFTTKVPYDFNENEINSPLSDVACEDGWTHFRPYNLSPESERCYLAVKSPMSAPEAKQYCHDRLSNLLNLDHIDQLYHTVAGIERSVIIPEFIFDNFQEFWSGMYISDKRRLMWDDFGLTYLKRNHSESRPWDWKPGQPVEDLNMCGHVTLGTRAVDPNGNSTTNFIYNGVTEVDMVPCAKEHPFVCEKPTIEVMLSGSYSSNCAAGWIGNAYMPFCVRLTNETETATYEGAKARCSQLGGDLAIVNDVSYNSFNRSLVDILLRNAPVAPWVKPEFWVQSNDPIVNVHSEMANQCPAMVYMYESGLTDILTYDCNAELSFLCTRPVEVIEQPQMTVSSPYLDQESLDSFAPWTNFPVSVRLDRPLVENEMLYIHTPFTSHQLHISNNYPSNAVYVYNGYTVAANSYSVNVTLPGWQRPAFAIYEKKLIAQMCGYYSFGIYSINTAIYVETEPVLIRYSERDLYIYVADISISDWAFKMGNISEQDVILRRLLNDDSYTPFPGYIFGSSLTQLIGRVQSFVPRYYRGLIEDVNFRNKTIRIRLFVFPENSTTVPKLTEQVLIPFLEENLRYRLNEEAFNTSSLKLRSTVACPSRSVYDKERNTSVTFPTTRVGDKAYSLERCYLGKGALASAMCRGGYDDGASWDSPVYTTGCEAFPVLNQSSSTSALKNISETTITKDNVVTILRDTANLTSPTLNLTEADIIYTADILFTYQQLSDSTPTALDDVFDVVDNIIQAEPESIYSAQKLINSANRIIRSVDELTNDFKMTRTETKKIVRSFVASAVRFQTGGTDLVIGLKLVASASPEITEDSLAAVQQPADVIVNDIDAAIYLSRDIVKGATTRLSFHIYSKTELFAVPQGRFVVNSKVAAARLERNGRPVVDLGDDRVTVVFDVKEISDAAECGYWDYSANEDAGGWRTDGCTTTRNGSKVICECDHLTNFAVLIDLKAIDIDKTHKYVLGVITKIGLVISLIGLSVPIITFLTFKHLRTAPQLDSVKQDRVRFLQIRFNLCVAMFCSALIFLVGMDRTESRAGCKVVAALLHYFILASFAWMLVEGVLQYLRFVKLLDTYIPKFTMKSMITAWGTPLIPMIIVLAVDHDLYYGGNGYCWLDTQAMIYAFIIPVAMVIFANLILFMLVMYFLYVYRRNTGMRTNQSESKMAFTRLQTAVSIFVILGLTWVFGFMAVNEAQLAFHYIFAILNAFQGFFIFLLFTAANKRVREAWLKLCCKENHYRCVSYSTSGTGTDGSTLITTSGTGTNGNTLITTSGTGTNGNTLLTTCGKGTNGNTLITTSGKGTDGNTLITTSGKGTNGNTLITTAGKGTNGNTLITTSGKGTNGNTLITTSTTYSENTRL